MRKNLDIVRVHWRDSEMFEGRPWMSEESALYLASGERTSVGMLLSEPEDDTVILAGSYADDEDDPHYGCLITIPSGSVTSQETIAAISVYSNVIVVKEFDD